MLHMRKAVSVSMLAGRGATKCQNNLEQLPGPCCTSEMPFLCPCWWAPGTAAAAARTAGSPAQGLGGRGDDEGWVGGWVPGRMGVGGAGVMSDGRGGLWVVGKCMFQSLLIPLKKRSAE